MNNLLIIGNGFDLAHNMKTSYNHFIESTDRRQFDIMNNQFFEILNEEKNLKNWCDIEQIYFKHLDPTNSSSYYRWDVKKLNNEFEVIKKHLSKHLEIQEKEVKPIDNYKTMFRLIDSKETTILNFNYTNTLKYLYSTEIKKSRIIHIHGELSNPNNPIIFGYAANDKESRELIDKGDNEYMRNIKKHLYKRTENEKLLTYYLKGTKDTNVTILGHSCGLSDKLILNQILNDENVKSINIFYYEEYEQYFQAQVNIDRIMNNDDNFKKLVDFNSSHRMPQYSDTLEQQKAFIEYITPIMEERKERKRQYYIGKASPIQ